MYLLPLGFRFRLFLCLIIASGFCILYVTADYSIGTIIETSGAVKDSFSGTWHNGDGTGTNTSGVYTDSVMTNGGSISLTKQINMKENCNKQPEFETQKIIGYLSGDTGSHLMADEYILTSTSSYTNESTAGLCFGLPYLLSSCSDATDSASFTVANARELKLSSSVRNSDGLDYAVHIGEPGSDSAEPGLEGTLITRFNSQMSSKEGEVRLYDRTLISGLIDTFSRLYHGGDSLNLVGTSSGTGPIHDKTILEQKFSTNGSDITKEYSGTAVYSQDLMANGGTTHATREIAESGSISSERIIVYQSDGDRSIQASEHAIATRTSNTDGNNGVPGCVFGGEHTTVNTVSPYQEASAQTSIAGVSSAKISSTTRISDPEKSKEINLEYRADMEIPIGFNMSFVREMKDSDNDGRYEDLNGNGRFDMHDIVLLFHNFRWIGESNVSARIDFNQNGRADYADIVTIFNSMNQTVSK